MNRQTFVRTPEDQLGASWVTRQLPWTFPQQKVYPQPMPLGPPHPSVLIDTLKSVWKRS